MVTAIIYGIVRAILYGIACLLFAIEVGLGKILDLLYDLFLVYSGAETITYDGNETTLINVFFDDTIINTIYWGMALIGVVLTFGFAVVAVVKKIFDSTGEKVKATYGMIIGNVAKAIILIFLMTAIVNATMTTSNLLMKQINELFDSADEIAHPSTIEFTDEDFATMFRIIDTIANHGLNTSYDNRFNLNSCFNEIRGDMQVLKDSKVFDYTYEEYPKSWQYALVVIYQSADISQDLDIDIYNEKVSDAMLYCIDLIKNDKSFAPLEKYTRATDQGGDLSSFGRVMMLVATTEAAENDSYNGDNASFRDSLRLPYFTGSKNIYDRDQVEDDFSIELWDWNHILAIFCEVFLIYEFIILCINCVARIFNIIVLYIVSPGFIAVLPLDDGGKLKQWTTAFVIQTLSIFGNIISIRLLVIFIPIIMDGNLVMFDSGAGNMIAKVIFVIAACVTSTKASAMFSGILADNAGYQSIMAGDAGSGVMSAGLKVGGAALSLGAKAGGKVLGGLATATGLSTVADKAKKSFGHFGQALRDRGGVGGAIKNGLVTDQDKKEAKEKADKEAEKKDTDNFRAGVLGGIKNLGANGGGNGQGTNRSTTSTNNGNKNPQNLGNPKGPGTNDNNNTNNNNSNVPPTGINDNNNNNNNSSSTNNDNNSNLNVNNLGNTNNKDDDGEFVLEGLDDANTPPDDLL